MPINPSSLSQFTGTQGYTRWSVLFHRMVLSDGAKYVAENGGTNGAFWLMDLIASYQPKVQKTSWGKEIQFWTLKVDLATNKAVVTCTQDSDIPPFVTQNIEYSDFDLPEIKFYVSPLDEKNYVIFLPSEY